MISESKLHYYSINTLHFFRRSLEEVSSRKLSEESKKNPKKTPRATHRSVRQSSTSHACALAAECQKTLQERAHTNSSMLGRRYYELNKQSLDNKEVLRGNNMNCNTRVESKGVVDNACRPQTTIASKSTDICAAAGGNQGRPRSQDYDRPHTVASFRPGLRSAASSDTTVKQEICRPLTVARNLSNDRHSSPSDDIPSITVTKIFDSETDAKGILNRQRCVSASLIPQRARGMPGREVVTFCSVSAMQKAYNERVKSAPAPRMASLDTTQDNNDVIMPVRDSPVWKSLVPIRGYRQQSTPRQRLTAHSTGGTTVRRGLRPLVCAESEEVMCCTSECKQCFRACLASDDYFQKEEGKGGQKRQRRADTNRQILMSSRQNFRIIRRDIPKVA